MRKIFSIVILLVATLVAFGPLSAQEFDVRQLQSRLWSTIDKVTPAVVSIVGRGSAFSGVIVTAEGHVLSAGHTVVPNARYRITLPDGQQFEARGMGASEALDCGMLKLESTKELPFVPVGNSSKLVTNQPCLGLSYPGGTHNRREPVARFGHIVQTRNRQGMIQSTALMEPGDSGGALFDLNGNLIGIHSRIGRSMARNYDVPIDTFKKHWGLLNRAERFSDGSQLPHLGFEGEVTEDRDGIAILSLVDDGPAKNSGLKINDVITAIQDQDIKSIRGMRSQLIQARKQGVRKLKLTVRREGQLTSLSLPFRIPEKNESSEAVLQTPATPSPIAISELSRLPEQFSALESKLDDHCITVQSDLGGKPANIRATRLANCGDLVSKSSMVGSSPYCNVAGKRINLDIVARDAKNDLVLLRSPNKNPAGVDLNASRKQQPDIGRLLLTPDPDDAGQISIWSTGEFVSRKRQSKGFLGVLLMTYQDSQGVILEEVHRGAARNAGLQVGDVIVRMDSTKIRDRSDILRFLGGLDPLTPVTAVVQRGDEDLKKEITLGAPPSGTNHAADMMVKSGRRDGFTRVISHDAALNPNDCGGPLYDVHGEFIGLNIARYSRVRSYAIPGRIIKSFVEQNQ